MVSIRSAKSKARIRAKAWREKYPERYKALQRNCYLKRRDYYLKKSNDYRLKHKEERKAYDFKRRDEEPHRKLLLESKIQIECKLCNSKENINGIQMSVHHIDGDHENNVLNNLVWIFESCHQYVHNPKGINSEMVVINGYC